MANQTRIGAPKASGGLFSGPLGTELPTDATTALGAGLKLTGLVGEDGLSETTERNNEQERAWGGQIARVVQSEYGLTFTFTFIERTDAVLKEVLGEDNVEITSPSGGGTLRTLKFNNEVLPSRVYVADMKDGATSIRKVYPNAQITEVGDVQYVHSALIKYEVTVTAYPDENGNNAYEYEFTPASAPVTP